MVQGSCDVIHLTSSILLLSCLISSDFLTPPWARKFFLVGARISSLKLTLQRYDNGIAVLEYCHKKFFFKNKFCTENDGNLLHLLQCYSSRKAFHFLIKTSIFIYKYRVNF